MMRSLRALLVGLLVLMGICVQGAHVLGGNITYQCLGGDNYLVSLDLFYDCSGTPAIDQVLEFTSACDNQSVTIPAPPPVEVSQICPSQLPNSTCNGGGLQGVNLYSFQVTVNLPPCPGGYLIHWVTCCRASTINLVGQTGTWIEATLRNDLPPCTDSPQFAENTVPYICVGEPYSYNLGVSGAGGQTLTYTLIGARGFADSSTPITYQSGYNGGAPVPGTTMDPLTGQLLFTPTQTGKYVFVVRIDQYDSNGVLIGSVMRDIMLIAMPCSGSVPASTGPAVIVGPDDGIIYLGNNTIEVCDGYPFCFSLTFEDPDATDVLSATSQAAAQMPGSIVTVTGTNPMTVTICWTGDINRTPVNLLLQVNDGACPIMNTTSVGVNISTVTWPGVPPDAGTDATAQVCPTAVAFDLIDELGGTPEPGGVWTAPDGSLHGPQFDPATDPAGVYTYTVGNACSHSTATLTVSFTTNVPNAGVNGTLSVCSNAGPVPLITGLGGTPDATGTWTRQSDGAAVGANFNPATGTPGVYVYTVPGAGGCASASAAVTVTVVQPANAGTNGTLAFCSNGAAASLFNALGGSPNTGGAWTGPSTVVGGQYNPVTMNPGVYTYTVAGTVPCGNATATVTVTENAPPNAGVNGTLNVCSDGATTSLFNQLGGTPDAGGAWTGPSTVVGGQYNPVTMNPGVYTYTVTGTGPCGNATATVTVTEQAATDAGTNGTLAICANGTAQNLFAALGGTPNAVGVWTGPSTVVGGQYNPATMDPGVYTYTVAGTAPCGNATATVTVTEQAPADAGTNGTLSTCSDGAAVSLFAALGGTPDAGGAWTGPSTVVGGQYDPATMDPGVYTYTVAGTGPCGNATATVTVTEQVAADAGTNGTLDVCANGGAEDLFARLGGTPDGGGTWTGPSVVSGNSYDPATMDPGVYTYTVAGTVPCGNATATVTVTENAPPNAGVNGTLNVCSDGATTSLFSQLGGTPDAGGAWTGPSTVAGDQYDPATMDPGVYTYTVAGTGPCGNATATVTVTEQVAADAGTNGTLDVCANGGAEDLFARLGGTPDAGGTWTGPSVVSGNSYDPATMDPGVYTYTVTGTAPCGNATATVTVTEQAPADAGINGTLSTCSDGAAANLFAALGGTPDAGGAWTGPSTVVGGQYDPATMDPGVYTYTVAGTGPCGNATATVTVTEQVAADAGTNGTLDVCANGGAEDLFARLGGTPDAGGTWTGPSVVSGNSYDPATMDPGVYTYTVAGTAPCGNATATVTVTEQAPADAGTNGTLSTCSDGAAANLFAALGGTPDAGGAWTGPSTVVGGQYDPATMDPGVYTYTVAGTGPCGNATAAVTVTEQVAADAGANGTLDACANGGAEDLFARLGGTPDAGGTWTGPSVVSGNSYDPATMDPGVYTYTVAGTAPCGNATATVTVTEQAPADAGINGTLSTCSDGAAANLFAALGGTPDAGGAWTGPSTVVGGQYDPATMDPGVYTYTVAGTGPCGNATAAVTVTEQVAADAGTNGTLDVCANGGAEDLFARLGGTPDAGGTWTGPSVVSGNSYDPVTMDPGVYTYTVAGTAPCGNATATVTVTEQAPPNAGINGTLNVCADGTPADLFGGLGGTPNAGGIWSGPSVVLNSEYDPATMDPGVYTYTVAGTGPCVNVTATVTVTEQAPSDAGSNGLLSICSDGAPADLFGELGGSPDAGGTWSGSSAVLNDEYDPVTMDPGVYTYTVIGVGPCGNSAATVTVTEPAAPDAGTNGTLVVCSDGAAVSLFAQLGGTPDAGGTWTGPSAVVGGQYDPATMDPGVYTYTVAGIPPCGNAIATVTVTEQVVPDAGANGTLTVCDQGAPSSLFGSLGGNPDAGGAWTGPSTVTGNNYDPVTMDPGVYTYTVTGTAPCGSASATVTVTETGSPDAGTDGAVTVCSDGTPIDLFAELGGTPDGGGTWSGGLVNGMFDPAVNAGGAYTYTLAATPPCQGDQSAVVVTVAPAPDAGTNGTLTVCDQGAPSSLLAALGGSPDAGGAWTGPSTVTGNNYDPVTMDPGVYTYTVTGTAPCGSASATVTVTETGSPDAGTDGAVTVCSDGTPIDLFAELGGTPDGGGTWSGGLVNGMFDPAVNAAGTYTYTLAATPPCQGDQSAVVVTVAPAPDAGTNGTLTVCDQGAPSSLLAALGGSPNAGGAWTGPSTVTGNNYDPVTMDPGVYTYTVTGTAPCGMASATVTVTETGSPDAGTDGAVTVCSDGTPIDLFAELGGTPDGGGTWSGGLLNGMFDPAVNAGGTYTYTLAATPPCQGDQSAVVVTVAPAPDAGANGTLTVCDQGAPSSLLAALGGSPDAGGAWTGPSTVTGGNYDPVTMDPGVYTYTVTGQAPCGMASATVTVTETGSPDAGTDGAVTVCSDGTPIDLFAALGGTPDGGGTWSGGLVNGMFDPAVNAGGAYTYTLAATPPCQGDQSAVVVTVAPAPDAGTNGTLTVCDQGAPSSLLAALGGSPDAGGAWTGPSTVTGNNYDPVTMDPGVYTYTVTGTAPCGMASATVTVTETGSPDAGTDGAVTVCSDGTPIDLFAELGGTPDGGGTWSGGLVNGMFDPAVNAGGTYTYTLVATPPCQGDQSAVVVTVAPAPDAGANGTLTVCDQGAPSSLFGSLGGNPDAGGTWTGPSTVVGNNYDPVTMDPGVYTYTVTGTAPCGSASATVTVTETGSPDAGTDGAVTVCSDGTPIDLFAALGGTPDGGGTWSGGLVNGMFDPAVNPGGTYTYTLAATPPCQGDQSAVVVTVAPAPDAGTNGTLTVCDQGAPSSLLAALGGSPDAGGAWTGPSTVTGGNYDPVTMDPGVYTYTVTGQAPCGMASATVTVTETGSPDAGTDGAVTVCSDGTPIDLFAALGGTPDGGGTWSGGLVNGMFDPAVNAGGAYTYTLAATPPCQGDQSAVVVTVAPAPDAGTNGTLTVCDQGAPSSLLAALGGSPDAGGAWTGPSTVTGGNYDPVTMDPGVYTYTVTGQAPCGMASATVTVTETGSPDAGTDGAVTVCSDGTPIDLFAALGGTPDGGGTWSGGLVNGMFDPTVNPGGTYTYTLAATPPCQGDQSAVVVTVAPAPDAGTNGTLTVCDQGAPSSLFAALGGTPDAGGTWTGPSTVTGGNYDPVTMDPGVYTYTVTGQAPCGSASATVTVTETGSPDAGTDGAVTVCSDGTPIDLFAELGGTPDGGGTWSGGLVNGMFDPAVNAGGAYTYTLAATPPCQGDQSDVVVTVAPAPDAGTNGTLTVCDQGAPSSLLAALGGSPNAGGAWTGPSTVTGNNYDPVTMDPGVYTYTVTGTAPCGNASATVTVTETGSPDAGTDGAVTVCSDGTPIDLFAELGGTPDGGGTWSGGLVNGMFDPAVNAAGTYTYTVTAASPCIDASAQVVVVVESLADPGLSSSVTVCTGDAPFELFAELGGDPDAGGIWLDPAGSTVTGLFDPASSTAGTYTYQIAGGVCVDVSATVETTVLGGPNAGQNNAVALCSTGPFVGLLGLLSGNPDHDGTWLGPGSTPVSGTIDPATAASGDYTYTVLGNVACPDASAVVTVTINQAPDAGTDTTLALCSSDAPVSLFPLLGGTPDPGGTWSILSDGQVFNGVVDPAHGLSGTYVYTVTGQTPCASATAHVTVAITHAPFAGDDNSVVLCSSDVPVSMQGLLGGTPNTGGVWTGPDGNPGPDLFSPATSVPGIYSYMVPAVGPCPQDMAELTIALSQAALAGIGHDTALCADGDAFHLISLLTGPFDDGGTWTGPGDFAWDGWVYPDTASSGPYIYTVTPDLPCPAVSATVMVDITPLPVALPTFSMDDGCAPVAVTFTSEYNGPGTCHWDFGNGLDTTACGPVTIIYEDPGDYLVRFTADPGNGCAVTLETEQMVHVVVQPEAAFSVVGFTISSNSPTASFQNLSTGANSFLWDFGGLGTSVLTTPQFSFPLGMEGIYEVCLVAAASPECTDTACAELLVPASASVFVPNSFTPDGDGTNDQFAPVIGGLDPSDYQFLIFDRWGQLIFSTEDPYAKWDGTYKGMEAPLDVYVWKVIGQDIIAKTRFERIGHVTLLR